MNIQLYSIELFRDISAILLRYYRSLNNESNLIRNNYIFYETLSFSRNFVSIIRIIAKLSNFKKYQKIANYQLIINNFLIVVKYCGLLL